jgi:dihydroorotate dehydrogenase electron transfer subunit
VFETAGADVIPVTDEDGASSVENVRAILERHIADGRADGFYTCGSNRLMALMKEVGAKHRIPGQVALEQQMACGLGMCFCCVRSFEVDGEVFHRRVCCEGPVFDMQEALSW